MRIRSYNPEKNIDNKSEKGCELSFQQYSVEKEMRIDVYKGVRTFGLALVGGANNQQSPGDSGIYVSKVQEGGLAEVDGRIMPGDRIAAIKQFLEDGDAYTFCFDENGSATHEDAKQILRRCKGNVALFIVRKDEILSTCNENDSAVNAVPTNNYSDSKDSDIYDSQNSTSKHSGNDNSKINNNNEQTLCNLNLRHCSDSKGDEKDLSHNTDDIPSISSTDNCDESEASKMQLINLTPLRHFRTSQKSVTQAFNGCSMDYREMAKYGIRPGSSLSKDILQPDCNQIKEHRIKKTWLKNKISAMSIQEDDEEQSYTSLPQINHKFEMNMEQRVL